MKKTRHIRYIFEYLMKGRKISLKCEIMDGIEFGYVLCACMGAHVFACLFCFSFTRIEVSISYVSEAASRLFDMSISSWMLEK